MNIALLTQAIQGSTARAGVAEGESQSAGGFLDLLSAMLGSTQGSGEQTALPHLEEGVLPEAAVDLEKMAKELESWFQKPDTLNWLKSLPQDAYRTFMDAYVGLLGQLSNSSQEAETLSSSVLPVITQASSSINVMNQKEAAGQTPHVPVTQPVPNQELAKHVQTIQRIITQHKGPGEGTMKEVPVMTNVETVKIAKPALQSSNVDWMPKGMNWSRPQIDVDTVMYASKGSLPENLQARIEAALQKAPFKSGADGSKVFTVRLYPEQLGELVVKLERKNGELVVKMFASSQEAKQLIQSQVQQLQQTLAPHSQNVRVEVNLTQQALDSKSGTSEGSEQPDQEQPNEQPKGGSEDDEHPTEDE
ncbi:MULTISPECIES: flagellar hook-length control protein FliK [unclassified Exiguobacterium]|uniref:flagellar hook-length control protein FliK n=1 Tax=unclassified Exiguobacterium TaxID=2644629 RepID=UPI001BEBC070|nr:MULTISPECIES: flagellar hook-length control protein FliK [unclassified Exiguobacterium]